MKENGLNRRLQSAAEFVRQDAVFADIGTDHAYLPLFLLSAGRIRRAVLADINEGPLESAGRNAAQTPYLDRVELVLTDGAAALAGKGITDYAICGMGGELISEIIERAPHLRCEGLRLILQPMTRQGHLRRYLAGAGFSVLTESYSEAEGKYYVCLCVEYTGVRREIDDCEAEFGSKTVEIVNKDLQKEYIKLKKKSLLRAYSGKRAGGESADREEMLLGYAERLLDS